MNLARFVWQGAVARLLVSAMLLVAADAISGPWQDLVPIEGQQQPVPAHWLQDAEARIAHSLRLPDSVRQSVPFDFHAAVRKAWLPGEQSVDVQYFNHLCKTEAGEWIFRKEKDVEGLYFARPQKAPSTEIMTDPYGPEMPWIQRIFILKGDNILDQGSWFVWPPLYNYRFVEQPHRAVDWQASIDQPYVRIFGLTHEYATDAQGNWTPLLRKKTPMQVAGIPAPSARYGYTWRGLKRPQDRENNIAGGEVLIYDLRTKEDVAVRRQFLKAPRSHRAEGSAMWEAAASCREIAAYQDSGEFTQFAFDVLSTIEPSTTRKKSR